MAMHPSPAMKMNSVDSFQPRKPFHFERLLSPEKINTLHRATETCRTLLRKNGIHSVHALKAAGFYYTNKNDSARCDECQLEVSNWPLDITPFTIHKQLRQDCPFVLSILPHAKVSQPSKIPFTTSNTDETSCQHQQSNRLVETDKMKLTRARTFTNWPYQTSPSIVRMIAAGFFDCCVGDRVICLYCDLICQQWIPNKNDPWEVHKTHSPKCPYVSTMSEYHQEAFNASINEIMNRAACYSTDSKISKQSNVEYINWFPHRLYAEQLCLKELYQKIKNSRPIQPKHDASHNKKQLTRLINGRLDLTVSKNLVAEGFDLSIIESCYENRFRLTGEDFINDCDLRMACTILQKQIKLIDGNDENIFVPNVLIATPSTAIGNESNMLNFQHMTVVENTA